MKDEATPEMIAMARRIAEGTRIDGPLGLGPPDAFKAALAAIIETTERTLAWLEAEYGNSANNSEIPLNAIHMVDVIRRCIRDGEHLKEQSNAE